ncbi:hypothetical protein ACRAWD_26705 [Caulobacter segnis]
MGGPSDKEKAYEGLHSRSATARGSRSAWGTGPIPSRGRVRCWWKSAPPPSTLWTPRSVIERSNRSSLSSAPSSSATISRAWSPASARAWRGSRSASEVFARPRDHQIGAFAERIAVAEADLALEPASLSMAEAASLPLVALTAWQVLVEVARVKRGDKVMIHAGSRRSGHDRDPTGQAFGRDRRDAPAPATRNWCADSALMSSLTTRLRTSPRTSVRLRRRSPE